MTLTGQLTEVRLQVNERIQGQLISFERGEGLTLALDSYTMYIRWDEYRSHRRVPDQSPLTFGAKTDSLASLLRKYPALQKYNLPERVRSNRFYLEFAFSITDGLGAVNNRYGAPPGVAAGIGWRMNGQMSFGLFTTFNNIEGYEVVSIMGEGRYHLTPTRTSPYVVYRIGSGFSTRNFLRIQNPIPIKLNTYGGIGLRFGRHAIHRQYFELGFRTFQARFPEAAQNDRFAVQHYLNYTWGIQF